MVETVLHMVKCGRTPCRSGWLYYLKNVVKRVGKVWPQPTLKAFAVRRLLARAGEIDIVLTHGLGGGAESYLSNKISNAPDNRAILVTKPMDCTGLHTVDMFQHGRLVIRFQIPGLSAFLGFEGRQYRIVLNELVGWPTLAKKICNKDLSTLVAEILELKKRLGATMVYLLHDYYCICPKYTLIDHTGAFCWPETGNSCCSSCLKATTWLEAVASIEQWRTDFSLLLSACDKIIAFSGDTKRRVQKFLPNLQIEVIPHELTVQFKPLVGIKNNPLTIGVVGTLFECKGLKQVIGLGEYLLALRRNDVKIKVVGSLPYKIPMPSNIEVLGRYQVSKLPEIIEQEGINIVFFSSIVAETFSYVTKELIALGLPIACFDLGAQRDHIAAHPNGAIIPEMTAESAWNTILQLYDRVYNRKRVVL